MPSLRHRNIASASSGLPERVTVVLYACIYDSRDPDNVLENLRKHAEARDWIVHSALHDVADITSSRGARQVWPDVERLLRTREVEGVVAPAEDEIVFYPQSKAQFREMLLSLPAFASYLAHKSAPEPTRSRSEGGSER
ncbi:hypothetical protein M1P56_21275 [Streptomyces sp. HU2014]|uniref:hypothetical protein n=1 Tax=Streptomyces sp. HU2014 TaxID=2939414 RepID=UPI00200E5BAE|nr:hypothetical protein [Streptomyces sp. HU2014]UQI46700.1 hypothetical protein M1P56_21275 [Streptomyces sp. HU2014]